MITVRFGAGPHGEIVGARPYALLAWFIHTGSTDMQFRRIVLALALCTAVGLTAACGQDSGSTPQGAATASSGATGSGGSSGAGGSSGGSSGGASGAASQPAGAKGNTEAACKNIVAAYDKEKVELVGVISELAAASLKEDKAAVAAAEAKGKVILDRLAKAVEPEIAKVADPQAKAALQQFVATFGKMLSGTTFADEAFEAEMEKATTEAAKYCPALAD
ncbi:hypothetical protein ACFO1B_32045 [Dactylosporangium siamense]|uniref:Uncharacterized protein n=1 Tax=Dactylosporangium siamense TaxID=685454 RepID=A0A919PSL9_9ACTN|nr:hypothetical protein [Dactylosporangium siamense]GIG48606.1 hypothetical protein Dsi01nite_066470 [Dactylosporangium siamense]